MKIKKSAGILLYKIEHKKLHVLLVHPGGPFWRNKDLGSWSIPKGEYNDDEDALAAAMREFAEETGTKVDGAFLTLTPVRMKSGKVVCAWAIEADLDASAITCNEFEMEWPPKSGKFQSFPEVDRAEWFEVDLALDKINEAQRELVLELRAKTSR